MFKRMIFEDYAAVLTVTAFAVALTIFLWVSWRALRMPRRQADQLANLPFSTDSEQPHHDTRG
jgi:ABC-type nickel/cobalt efflux system permease component RcnA